MLEFGVDISLYSSRSKEINSSSSVEGEGRACCRLALSKTLFLVWVGFEIKVLELLDGVWG